MNQLLSVVIPVYNEERTIRVLLDRVASVRIPQIPLEIIVVNDGSTDRSPALIREWRDALPANFPHTVLLLDQSNGGKGSAVRAGIVRSSGGAVIVQDADLEYDPADYEACARPILAGECKVVYGSREDANRNRIYSSPGFYLGALSLTFWVNLLFNANLTDEATCYKTFDGDLIRALLFEGDHFEWEPEITAKLLRLGYEIREVPISYYPRKTSEGKKIRFADGMQGFGVALRWRFRSMKKERAAVAALDTGGREQVRQVRNAQLALLSVVLIAVLARLIYAIPGILNPDLLMRPDSASYLGPAMSLLQDGVYASSPGGALTAVRTPFYPLYLAFCLLIGGQSLGFCAAVSAVLGGLIACPVYLAARLFGSWRTAFFAALLFALNPTAIALSPMFLSDTLFLFVISFQVLFFVKFIQKRFALFFFAAVFFAGLGTLVRPINLLWLVPCLFVLWCIPRFSIRLKGFYSIFAAGIFAVLICPWMARNAAIGAGFQLDAIESLGHIHNSAALESRITGIPGEELRQKYQREFDEEFDARPEQYATFPAKAARIRQKSVERILAHPWHYLSLHFRPYILFPDLPTFLENLGIGQSGRGTFDVLNREGPVAAVRHYFGGRYGVLLLTLPLILAVLTTYLLAAGDLIRGIFFRRDWMLFLLFLLLAEYYLFLPGPIAMPRYQLPALLFFCILAGRMTDFLLERGRAAKKKKQDF